MQKVMFNIQERQTFDQKLNGENAYSKLFKNILKQAIDKKASDLHIEPFNEGVRVRGRVLGELQEWESLDLKHRGPFIVQLKELTGMSMAIKGKAQDSRVSYPSLKVELRGSAAPTEYDDKLVFRIIYSEDRIDLESMGLKEKDLSTILSLTKLHSGLILFSGPTGSGKSTTIYGFLHKLDRKRMNVMTIEDPIEKTLNYTTQLRLRRKFDFSSALKTSMRQDPDVIFVGEIRDSETAKLAIEAANTGHLVISTIHANDSYNVIGRLLGLGIEKDQIEETLCFSSAQRLIPLLCNLCKQEKKVENEKYFVISEKGCSNCLKNGRPGIISRIPVIEYLTKDNIKSFVDSGKRTQGRGLKENVFELIKRGKVSYEELRGFND